MAHLRCAVCIGVRGFGTLCTKIEDVGGIHCIFHV